MAAKTLILCASVLFVKTISAQCIGALNAGLPGPGFIPDSFPLGPGVFGPGMSPINGYASLTGINPSNLGASFGGGLAVTSSSPISPTGLTVTSENAIEGALAVAGNLPFLGTVAVEGAYQTAGAGTVSYGCGNGAIGITAENAPTANFASGIAPASFSPGAAQAPFAPAGVASGYGPGYGWGPGCGALY